jgi:TPR repeat protein
MLNRIFILKLLSTSCLSIFLAACVTPNTISAAALVTAPVATPVTTAIATEAVSSISDTPARSYSKGVKAYLAGDFKRALTEWTPAAEQGFAEAQYNLGHMYRKGQGVPHNDIMAIKWYTLAAEQGEPVAQFNVGLMYQYGEGVPRNNKLAMKWLTLAAKQGHTFAQYNLGIIYTRGEGDLTDYERAYMWSNLSANDHQTSGHKMKLLLSNVMTASQISNAKEMSSRCFNSGYMDCY